MIELLDNVTSGFGETAPGKVQARSSAGTPGSKMGIERVFVF
jgi:hypothetical protein